MIFPYKDNIPARTFPVVTVSIIAVNIVLFLFELSLGPRELQAFIFEYGFIPAYFGGSAPASPKHAGFITSTLLSMFLHGGFLHLIGNMWWLWIFGDNVEDRLGHARYLVFYLLCGLCATIIHTIFNINSRAPAIGASGAIAGVLGGYMISFPTATVRSFVAIVFFWTTIELPAVIVLGFWFVIQLLSGTAAITSAHQGGGGIAWWAHIGGFLVGILLIKLMQPRQNVNWYA